MRYDSCTRLGLFFCVYLILCFLGGCEKEEGFYSAGNNVRGGNNVTILQCNARNNVPDNVAFRSAGPDDCAAKCSRTPRCKVWTLHKRLVG